MASHLLLPAPRVVLDRSADAVVQGGFAAVKDKDKDERPEAAAAAEADGALSPTIYQDEGVKRDAGWMDILYHSITAMVGAGVLGLPSAFAHLGWAGGLTFLAFSLWASWHTYRLLVLMHEVPDLGSKGGIRRLDRYDQLAQYVLGRRRGRAVLLPFQVAVLIGLTITYIVVGGDSLSGFAQSVANAGKKPVLLPISFYLMFGGLQIFLSMLPSLHDARLVSLLGALMSATYCLIAVVMSATVRPGSSVNYSPAAVPRSTVERFMGVCNALTTVFFAYGGHNVALEIQATIPVGGGSHPASSVPAMMRGVNVTFVVTGACYLGVAVAGFYAFGTSVGDNVLLAFLNGPHAGVVAAVNLMVVVHVAAAYQVFAQPLYSMIAHVLRRLWRRKRADAPLPLLLQLGVRVVYVLFATFIACLCPFFGALMGLVGAVAITPTTFLLPPLLWVLYKRPPRWGADWTLNLVLVYVTGALGVLGCIGSLYSIIAAWSSFKVFAA